MIGSGVAGLTAAYLLSRSDDVTLYEADDRLGGHAHTHQVPIWGGEIAGVDSGFIVHNDRTYPLLQRLFAELEVPTRATEMSMSITDAASGIAYAGGKGVRGFVARPRQLARPDFVRMLLTVKQFHRDARAHLDDSPIDDVTTFGEFVAARRYPRSFVELYAVPLVACVWSSGGGDAMAYPARYLFEFLAHHGMLSVGGSPQWRTVVGGSATYVQAVAARIGAVRTSAPVQSVERHPDGVDLLVAGGRERHDRVVVATHADQALRLLARPTPAESEVLGTCRYSTNQTVLHRDSSILPSEPGIRASWNFRTTRDPGRPPVVTYWMNLLQGIDPASPLLVTLNAPDLVDPATVIATMTYEHPVYTPQSVAAQRRLSELSTETTTFAGAYHGWGFHEDGCRSGVAAAEHFGASW